MHLPRECQLDTSLLTSEWTNGIINDLMVVKVLDLEDYIGHNLAIHLEISSGLRISICVESFSVLLYCLYCINFISP